MARESIGVIGIGLVGSALCAVLLRSGYDVLGYDVDPAKLDALVGVGGRAASSPGDVAQGCQRVMLSLPTSAEVEEVVAGIGSMPPGIVIDTTTGHPREVERLAARLAGQGVHFLDATIAGSSRQVPSGRRCSWSGAISARTARARTCGACWPSACCTWGRRGAGPRPSWR